ncbi:Homeobox-leucine zipper protein HDG9 [Cardamine amara subsp. amara]|uniref:Homeobox-leucine zipper protein HDG9 n=1 Tax=Cardamine amara subsp. amara TaxID=228776 RepID=A0ABD0ZLC0_CARAN
MDSSPESRNDSSSDERETSMNISNNKDKKSYHRHSNHQIQRLEAYFKDCPHPDESQRRQLGEELNLKPKQIKFWFQNKRTQAKTHSEKADNASLREENMRIREENEALQAALKSVLCPPCGGPSFERHDRELILHQLRLENAHLKQEYEKLSSHLKQQRANSLPNVDAIPYHRGPSSSSYGLTSNSFPASYGSFYNHSLEPPSSSRGLLCRENINITTPPQPRIPILQRHFNPLSQMDKIMMFEKATKAVAEVKGLIQMEEPMWTKSTIDGRIFIDQANYEKMFTKDIHVKGPTPPRFESSKEVVVVSMDAKNLVDMFLDTEKWARLFPTIVNEAKTIHVLEPMDRQGHISSLKLIYEQLHILSPLVPPREYMILRCCQQMEGDLWLIVDVSCHPPNFDFDFELTAPSCYKRPSGCLIQGLPDGRSKVTWIEHVEVYDKARIQVHRLYKDLLFGDFGYGARRWAITLERICERLSLSSISDLPITDYIGVVKSVEGRRNVMSLGERMVKNFARILKMEKKIDFSQQSETNNSGVRVSVRVNTEAGEPCGLILCAGSSLALPLPPIQVYNFLRSLENRHQWDVLCHGIPVTEVACFSTGTDHTNSVNFLQPSSATMESNEMMILQDGFIDALGGMVVYAPVDLQTAYAAISGITDPSGVAILPSGFTISRDSRPSAAAATEPNGGRDHGSTLLTVAFQILVSGPTYSRDLNLEESAASVNTLISSTVQRIKQMLNCDD